MEKEKPGISIEEPTTYASANAGVGCSCGVSSGLRRTDGTASSFFSLDGLLSWPLLLPAGPDAGQRHARKWSHANRADTDTDNAREALGRLPASDVLYVRDLALNAIGDIPKPFYNEH